MIIEKYRAQSLMRKAAPSLFSWTEMYLNPYQGCYHDCKYCDGKSEHYYMHEDYADRIKVKINAPELLETYLKKKGFLPLHREKTATLLDFMPSTKHSVHQPPKFILFIGGGVCDVYQPAEREVRMTRTLLNLAHDYRFPVFILTKNDGVLEDIDLLKKINKDSYAGVSFSITLADERAQKIFEPNASTTQERFEAIRILREEHIHSGIHFYPVLPFIGDTHDNMKEIYDKGMNCGAEFIYCWGLTLKPGRSKDEFLQAVKTYYPHLLPRYVTLYGNEDRYGHPDPNQMQALNMVPPEVRGYILGYERGMPYCAQRYIPEGRHKTNIKIAELLQRCVFLKTIILGSSPPATWKVHKVSQLLEEMDREVSSLDLMDSRQLHIPGEFLPTVQEFLEEGESTSMKDLEREAYHRAVELVQGS